MSVFINCQKLFWILYRFWYQAFKLPSMTLWIYCVNKLNDIMYWGFRAQANDITRIKLCYSNVQTIIKVYWLLHRCFSPFCRCLETLSWNFGAYSIQIIGNFFTSMRKHFVNKAVRYRPGIICHLTWLQIYVRFQIISSEQVIPMKCNWNIKTRIIVFPSNLLFLQAR